MDELGGRGGDANPVPVGELWSEEAPFGELGMWFWPGPNGPGGVRRLWRFMDLRGVQVFALPGPGESSGTRRMEAVLRTLAQAQVRYAWEPPFGWLKEGQHIRDPMMIHRCGEATCLDMALLVAAGLRNADLRSWIVLGVTEDRRSGHAWLIVDVKHPFPRPMVPARMRGVGVAEYENERRTAGWTPVENPDEMDHLLQEAAIGTGDLRLVDVARLTIDYPGGDVDSAEVNSWKAFQEPFKSRWVCDTGWWSGALAYRPGASVAEALDELWPAERFDARVQGVSLAELAKTDNRVFDFVTTDAHDRGVLGIQGFLSDLAGRNEPARGLDQVYMLVFTGEGGAGKTRLAKELVGGLDGLVGRSAGTIGVLPHTSERSALRAVAAEPGLVGVFIDYADAVPAVNVDGRSVSAVAELKRWLGRRPPGWGPVVIVATGREPDLWSADLAAFPHSRMLPLTRHTWGDAPRAKLFEQAAGYFSTLTGHPKVQLPVLQPWTALETIFVAGLVALADDGTPSDAVEAAESADELYRGVLQHEHRHWAGWWNERHGSTPSGGELENLEVVLAAATLTHPTYRELTSALEKTGYPPGCADVACRVGFGSFSSAAAPEGHRRRLPGIQPDPLADYLIRSVLRTCDAWPLIVALTGDRWRDLLECLQRAYVRVDAPAWLVRTLARRAEEDGRGITITAR